jgi:hypothetical protein
MSAFVEASLAKWIKKPGFTPTLKALNKGRVPPPRMMTVHEGVVEELSSGEYDAALQTDKGPLFLHGAERTERVSVDPQWSPAGTGQPWHAGVQAGMLPAGDLVAQLAAGRGNVPTRLLCAIEVARFTPSERDVLLPLLWQYIVDYRNSNDREELVGVAAALRKYIAIMPMERMGELAALLESGHRSPLPLDLEIEVAKMVYRNFEVHPSVDADPQPELAQRFWELVEAYINPRVLLRDKCSAAASLAIEAIVAMRSPLAETAWRKAMACPYRWFAELVCDDIDELQEAWQGKNADVARWLDQLRSTVLAAV